MVYSIRPFFLIILLFLQSCSAGKKVEIGKTEVTELESIEGKPLLIKKTSDAKSSLYHYSHDLKYQVRNKLVVGRFRLPAIQEEKYLVFWQNKFKKCQTQMIEHKSLEIEIRCEKEGISIFYTEGNGLVSRIVEYEKK